MNWMNLDCFERQEQQLNNNNNRLLLMQQKFENERSVVTPSSFSEERTIDAYDRNEVDVSPELPQRLARSAFRNADENAQPIRMTRPTHFYVNQRAANKSFFSFF